MDHQDPRDRALSAHRIDRIRILKARARYPRLHGKNAIKGDHGYGGDVIIAEIATDQGAVGWGTLCRGFAPGIAARSGLIGMRVSEAFSAGTGILNPDHAAFDIALHDLAGKILSVPVSRMINPAAASEARVYDGAIYMNDLIPGVRPDGLDRVLAECEADYQLGHRALKIKIGRGHRWMAHDEGLAREIELVNRIHEQLPDAVLMVDANDGYTPEDAIHFLDGVNCDIFWFEEPFRESLDANKRLRDHLNAHRPRTYIADGESNTEIDLLFELAGKGLLDIWQPDIADYGFTPWRTLMKALTQNGYLSSPHAWGQVVKTHYCAHLAAAYPRHVPYIEAVLGDTEGVCSEGYRLRNGILMVPDRPGFGMELYWAEVLEA